MARRMAAIWIVALALAAWHTLAAQPTSRLTLELADYAQMPHHRRARWPEHEGTAGQGELPARRAGRPAILRQRPQRAALHPRQADEDVHDLPRLQRRRRAARPVPEIHVRAQSRHRSHQLPLRSRLRRATASSTRFISRIRPLPRTRRRGPAWSPASTCPATRRRRRSQRRPWAGGSIAKPC